MMESVGIILGLIIIGCVIGFSVYNFVKLDKEKKVANVKEWLKWAVTKAEKSLGGGTGQLKLRAVYDLAVSKYPWLLTFVTFEMFDEWVKEALVWMEKQIDTNPAFKEYVGRK